MTARAPRLPFPLDPLIAEAKQRMRRRRLLVAAALAVVAVGTVGGMLAFGRSTHATPQARWQSVRACPRAGGYLTPNMRWEGRVTTVSISYATAAGLDRQIGPNEFQPAGTHPPVGDVPCNVAGMVADVAAAAWSPHALRHFAIRAGWTGENAGPTYRFTCAVERAGAAVTGACVHTRSRTAGIVRVRFSVRRFHRPT